MPEKTINKRWTPYTTVAAIIEQNGRYLLVRENTRDGIRLNNPAGHLEAGESFLEACERETLEESAYQFTPTALVGIYLYRFKSTRGHDLTYLRFAFSGELGEHFPKRALDKGIIETVWMTYDEITACQDQHRTPLLMQSIDDYRKGLHYPLTLLTANPSVWQTAAQTTSTAGEPIP